MFSSKYIIQNPYFGQNLTFKSADVTLKIRSGSPKSNQLLTILQTMYLCKLSQPPPHPHWFKVLRRKTLFWAFQSASVTLEMRSRSFKSNQLFPFSQQCSHASLVKIHSLVQKMAHGNHILDTSKCQCDLGN